MTSLAPLILVIEDELETRRFLRASLRAHDYQVVEAATAREGLAHLSGRNPDLVLLDLGLPDADGLEVVRTIRASHRTPVIVLSARGREQDKVTALDRGADDYLTKPFGVPELLARVRAILRRLDRAASDGSPRVVVGDLTIDLPNRRVEKSGELVHLTLTEWRVLHELVVARPKTVPHRLLLERVWGPAYGDEAHYIRVVIRRLRQKLEPDPERPAILLSQIGLGYRFEG